MTPISSDGDTNHDGTQRRPAEPPADPERGDTKVELEPGRQIARGHQTLELPPHMQVNDGGRHCVPALLLFRGWASIVGSAVLLPTLREVRVFQPGRFR